MVGLLHSVEATEPVDEVVVTCYPEGASYTGEEMVEVVCHGGRVVVGDVLELHQGRVADEVDDGGRVLHGRSIARGPGGGRGTDWPAGRGSHRGWSGLG